VPNRVTRFVGGRGDQPSRSALVRLEPWRAIATPGGETLWPQEASSPPGRAILVFDAPPPTATGVRLEFGGIYRWEPAVALAEVIGPDPQGIVCLRGAALVWPTGRLDLLAWKPGETHVTLVARPSRESAPGPPTWLPKLRLLVGPGSHALPCTPRADGTFAFSVPREHVGSGSVRLGVRAVGHRLPPLVLGLDFG
jgi:hypothetical protein